jgi:hypothetical protein
MSQVVRSNRSGLTILVLYVGVPGVLLIGLLVFLFMGGSSPTIVKGPVTSENQENHLSSARSALSQKNDLGTCKTVLPQLNAHLQKAKDHAVPPLSADTRAALAKQWGLSADDLDEVGNPLFTALDSYHLESCFLLRDAAKSLELVTPGGRGSTVKQTPLDQAELAFAWVMRQVRLPQLSAPPGQAAPPEPDPIPLSFALRRGWGTPLQRALIFLALLEQFGLEENSSSSLHGALLFLPEAKGQRRLWACGVAIGDKPDALYLFDPRLGLPIPGPDGKGVATLAQARTNPKVLGQLEADKLRYDVTPEDARQAEAYLFCALSALAPRMVLLQDRLLRDRVWNDQAVRGHVLRVRLATDVPAELSALQTAVKASGREPSQVHEWREGVGILRRFLPKEEGGSDAARASRQQYQQSLVPWQDFPRIFLDDRYFQPDRGLGLEVRQVYAAPFLKSLIDSDSPRELILRGRLLPAAPELVNEQEHWQAMRRRRQEAPRLQEGVAAWIEQALAAHAEFLRARGGPGEAAAKAQVAALWKWRPDDPIAVLLLGAAAEARGAEVTYQLGLCKHEIAARLQARKELAARDKVNWKEDDVKSAWKNAEVYWKEFADNYPNRLGANAVGLRRGEAQAMRGEISEAVATLRTLPASTTDLDKLARLWQARQLEKQRKAK